MVSGPIAAGALESVPDRLSAIADDSIGAPRVGRTTATSNLGIETAAGRTFARASDVPCSSLRLQFIPKS